MGSASAELVAADTTFDSRVITSTSAGSSRFGTAPMVSSSGDCVGRSL